MRRSFRINHIDGEYWPVALSAGDIIYSVDGYALPFQEGYTAMVSKNGHKADYPHYGIPLHCLQEVAHV